MQPLNQRDPRWARQQLGTSNTTIGSHGCTITCIAMLVGTTPDVVNKELKRVGAFANGNLVIWSKVPIAFPQLTFVKRVNSYNNDDVKANLPCLVEVDFDGSPVTFGNHWVVFIGNKRLLDPWTGQNRPTSSYPILKGYSIFKKKDGIIAPEVPKPSEQASTIIIDSTTEAPPQPPTTPETLPSENTRADGGETPTTLLPNDARGIRPNSVDNVPVESSQFGTSVSVDDSPPNSDNNIAPAPPKGPQIDFKTIIANIVAFCLKVLIWRRSAVK